MAEPRSSLIYAARLRPSEKEAILAHDAAFPASDLWSSLLRAVEDVCVDRLIRADGCLRLARQFALQTGDEEALRAGIARAYYSLHHSLRAMALWQNKWDPDGHEESIQQFRELLKNKSFRNRSGLASDASERVAEARTNRHVADYSPYDDQRIPPDTQWVGITGGTWDTAAQFNCDLASVIFDASMKVIGS